VVVGGVAGWLVHPAKQIMSIKMPRINRSNFFIPLLKRTITFKHFFVFQKLRGFCSFRSITLTNSKKSRKRTGNGNQ
jgi:hypothetical protein